MFKRVHTIFSTLSLKWDSHYTTVTKTSRFTKSVVEYLVNSLGFSKDEAFITSSKVSSFKSTVKPNSVIDFFKVSGFSQTQIKKLIFKEPRILSCKIDNTLKPKIKAFQDLGFSGNDLAHVLTVRPDMFWRSLDDHIIPMLELLKSLLCSNSDDNEILITVVKKAPGLLSPSAEKNLPDVISLLRSYGLSDDQIKAFSIKRTRYLALGTKLLESILIRVDKLRIPHGSPMFLHGLIAVSSLSKANLESRMGVYKSCGFTDDDILVLAGKNPYALVVSESRLRKGLDFFMKVVGHQPSEIASLPFVLTLSLDKRVIPRYSVWKGLKEMDLQKGTKSICAAFVSCLTMNEPLFFEKFVLPFKDEYPTIYHDYVKVARPVLKAAK